MTKNNLKLESYQKLLIELLDKEELNDKQRKQISMRLYYHYLNKIKKEKTEKKQNEN